MDDLHVTVFTILYKYLYLYYEFQWMSNILLKSYFSSI